MNISTTVNTREKFENKNGDLTAYAFACGYIQTKCWGEYMRGDLHLIKDGCYHVKKWDINGNLVVWNSFDTLSEARKEFRRLKKSVGVV